MGCFNEKAHSRTGYPAFAEYDGTRVEWREILRGTKVCHAVRRRSIAKGGSRRFLEGGVTRLFHADGGSRRSRVGGSPAPLQDQPLFAMLSCKKKPFLKINCANCQISFGKLLQIPLIAVQTSRVLRHGASQYARMNL